MNLAGETEARIDSERKEIDDLDSRIIELLGHRVRVSALIQKQRMDAGGPRTVLAREMSILARYRAGLGTPGTAIALNVLELCRGTAAQQPQDAGGES